MKPSFSLWGLVTTSRLSPALRPSMHTRWAEWRSCCSFSFPRAYLLLSNECSFAGISSSSSQQMRCITAGVRTGRAEDSAADTGSKRTPPNAKTLVKQLRERTSVSMGLCKRALDESNWVSFFSFFPFSSCTSTRTCDWMLTPGSVSIWIFVIVTLYKWLFASP